ncbi:DUF7673 family protein [Pseudomonas sp. RIT-To-2]|uniref:DUF7673 family protein n=1 Tax=Pseudomonas sp. RIT-To-2 TaxID=3462541 RepID=UPI0024137D7E
MIIKEQPFTASKTIISNRVIAAIKHLVLSATTGTSDAEAVADFLLAWYDAPTYGGFNITDLWHMDNHTRQAASTLFNWLSENQATPADLDLDLIFEAISTRWAV